MLVLLSPSKAMDFAPATLERSSHPLQLEHTQELVELLRSKSAAEIGALMSLSEKLSTLNYERYQAWDAPETPHKQAILAFTGDTYKDIPLQRYDEEDFAYAQDHVRILSGLYGVLRPLDLIQPYRLEMGTRLENSRGADLYAFWRARVSAALDTALDQLHGADAGASDRLVIDCASTEYFKVVDTGALSARVIEPVFKDRKGSDYKVISFFAKRARGMMADFIVRHRIEEEAALREFSAGGYAYDEASSTPERPVFLRDPS